MTVVVKGQVSSSEPVGCRCSASSRHARILSRPTQSQAADDGHAIKLPSILLIYYHLTHPTWASLQLSTRPAATSPAPPS
jgi:hypothetical protein